MINKRTCTKQFIQHTSHDIYQLKASIVTDENSTPRRERRPRRRRNIPRHDFDDTVPSPCVKVCWFSDDTDFCDGCRRTAEEIKEWYTMNREQKLELLEVLAKRKQDLGEA